MENLSRGLDALHKLYVRNKQGAVVHVLLDQGSGAACSDPRSLSLPQRFCEWCVVISLIPPVHLGVEGLMEAWPSLLFQFQACPLGLLISLKRCSLRTFILPRWIRLVSQKHEACAQFSS